MLSNYHASPGAGSAKSAMRFSYFMKEKASTVLYGFIINGLNIEPPKVKPLFDSSTEKPKAAPKPKFCKCSCGGCCCRAKVVSVGVQVGESVRDEAIENLVKEVKCLQRANMKEIYIVLFSH